MKKILLIVLLLAAGNLIYAQGYLMDWGSSFAPAWASGATSGTANAIGGSSINCTVSMVMTSGTLVAPYPQVNTNNTNAADFEVQSSTDAIEIDMNLSSRATGRCTITFNFSANVQNVQFGISDIDFPGGGSPWNYVDRVTVTGTGPSGSVLPTITKFNPGSNVMIIAGNVVTANTGAGGANVASLNQGFPDQNGTVSVDFGTNALSSITIVYDNPNIATVRTNPQLQAIAIGNLFFLPVSSVPLGITAFSAAYRQQQTLLNWRTAGTVQSGTVTVERSPDSRNWEPVPGIGIIPITQATQYSAVDAAPLPGTTYYRLKETTSSGSVFYTRIIRISPADDLLQHARIYPNPSSDGQFNLELRWPVPELLHLQLYNGNGQLLNSRQYMTTAGLQVIPGQLPANAPPGLYVLRLRNSKGESADLKLQKQ